MSKASCCDHLYHHIKILMVDGRLKIGSPVHRSRIMLLCCLIWVRLTHYTCNMATCCCVDFAGFHCLWCQFTVLSGKQFDQYSPAPRNTSRSFFDHDNDPFTIVYQDPESLILAMERVTVLFDRWVLKCYISSNDMRVWIAPWISIGRINACTSQIILT